MNIEIIIINSILSLIVIIFGFVYTTKGINEHDRLKAIKHIKKAEFVLTIYSLIGLSLICFGTFRLAETLSKL